MFGPDSFTGHLFQESLVIQLWVYWMMVLNTAALLFIRTREGQVVFAVWLGNALSMMALFEWLGWVKLLGLSHVVWWTPLLAYLALRLSQRPTSTPLGGYLRILAVTIFVSLLFDYYDVYLYLSSIQTTA